MEHNGYYITGIDKDGIPTMTLVTVSKNAVELLLKQTNIKEWTDVKVKNDFFIDDCYDVYSKRKKMLNTDSLELTLSIAKAVADERKKQYNNHIFWKCIDNIKPEGNCECILHVKTTSTKGVVWYATYLALWDELDETFYCYNDIKDFEKSKDFTIIDGEKDKEELKTWCHNNKPTY